jgi:hypothetical protein
VLGAWSTPATSAALSNLCLQALPRLAVAPADARGLAAELLDDPRSEQAAAVSASASTVTVRGLRGMHIRVERMAFLRLQMSRIHLTQSREQIAARSAFAFG